jgi:hypothetical protein
MGIDRRRKQDRERAERKRLRDEMDALASTREIDRALIAGLRRVIEIRYDGELDLIEADKCGDLRAVLTYALQDLRDARYDVTSPIQRARIAHRLGDASLDHHLVRPTPD